MISYVKFRKIGILVFVLIASALPFITSCSLMPLSSQETQFVGSWQDQWGSTWTFLDDGDFASSEADFSGSWKVNLSDTLVIKALLGVITFKMDYSFSGPDSLLLQITDVTLAVRMQWDLQKGDLIYLSKIPTF